MLTTFGIPSNQIQHSEAPHQIALHRIASHDTSSHTSHTIHHRNTTHPSLHAYGLPIQLEEQARGEAHAAQRAEVHNWASMARAITVNEPSAPCLGLPDSSFREMHRSGAYLTSFDPHPTCIPAYPSRLHTLHATCMPPSGVQAAQGAPGSESCEVRPY